jgi:hypothetical protein
MPPPRISILSLCVGMDKIMHNENIVFMGIQQLYIKSTDIKMNQKSIYESIPIRPLSKCISRFLYIIGQHWFIHSKT